VIHRRLDLRDGQLVCPDFPDAAKLIAVPDLAQDKRLAHLCLHQTDLAFALQCLDELATTEPAEPPDVVRRALWNAALVAAYKCFGGSRARTRLDPSLIFDAGDQRDTFDYFKHLRDKHIAHDDNDLAQAIVGAVLEFPDVEPKVPEVLCTVVLFLTVGEQNMGALRCVVDKALAWVINEIDVVSDEIRGAMNEQTYEELDGLPGVKVNLPTNGTIGVTRSTPAK
jgi:hypothetical protein